MSSTLQQKSLASQKVGAYLKLAQESESFWSALIVFLGALVLLGTFPFYPPYLILILAVVCGLFASKAHWAGTLFSMIFAFPAVAYQSPLLAWLFLLALAVTLFEMFEKWMIISVLQIFILAPFAFSSSLLFGWLSIFGMVVAAMQLGSNKSISISLPAVFMILFLSSIWLVDNSAFISVNHSVYGPAQEALTISKRPLDIFELPSALASSVPSLFSKESVAGLNDALGKSGENILKIFFADSGLLQIGIWGIALYLVSYLSGVLSGKRKQLLSSLALLLTIPVYYFAMPVFGVAFRFEMLAVIGASIICVGVLEQFGIILTHEQEVRAGEKLKEFGKFGLQSMGSSKDEKSLADIGDYEDVKEELRDSILLPLEKKELAYAYKMKPPAGILLFGPPGTGKTMLMRAFAKELKYGFYYVKASDILSQWFGESEKNLSELFSIARKQAPCILFFDEIDSIGKKRTAYATDEVTPRVLSILLQEMDGLKTGKPVLVVGATNIPQQLDPALLRPGRFDKIIYMHLPPKEARLQIFKVHSRTIPIDDDVDFDKLASKTERFSGADIKNVVQEALKMAAKEANKAGKVVPINMKHFLQVLQSVKPSTSIASLDEYEQFKLDFERRVGGRAETAEAKEGELIKWEDVAGLTEVKKTLLETIELPLLHEKEMKELKIKPSKGILLFGPPGTGKTLIVKAASNELKASFQVLSAAEIMKQGYTQAVTVIKETFNRARENTPAIVFVDEIETFAPARNLGASEVLGQFLSEMDGIRELKGVVVIAATNKPSLLDPAILRPGRFDKIFYIPPPSEKDRLDIFKIHLGEFTEDVDLSALAEATEGFSGADIASICQELKMEALRQKIVGKSFKATTDYLLRIIKKRRPSITRSLLQEYQSFLDTYGERGGAEEDEGNEEDKSTKKKPDAHYR